MRRYAQDYDMYVQWDIQYIQGLQTGEPAGEQPAPGSGGEGIGSGVSLRRCCCMQGYISCTHGERRQPQQRSPSSSGRRMSLARVGGDNWTGGSWMRYGCNVRQDKTGIVWLTLQDGKGGKCHVRARTGRGYDIERKRYWIIEKQMKKELNLI